MPMLAKLMAVVAAVAVADEALGVMLALAVGTISRWKAGVIRMCQMIPES